MIVHTAFTSLVQITYLVPTYWWWSWSSSSSLLCRVLTLIYLKQTIFLGFLVYTVLQLFCNYSSQSINAISHDKSFVLIIIIVLVLLKYLDCIPGYAKRWGEVRTTRASYSGDPGLKSRPEDRTSLSSPWLYSALPNEHFKLYHDRFLSHSLQLPLHW